MWAFLLIPAAALAGYLYTQRQPAVSVPPKDAKPPAPSPNTKVDGHGTGLIIPPVAGVPAPPAGLPIPGAVLPTLPGTGKVDGHGTGLLPDLAHRAEMERAANEAAARIAALQAPGANVASAAAAAEAVRIQIITALNTAEGDRTPEQLALLASISSLPELG